MYLGKLIKELGKYDPNLIVPYGFGEVDCFRGDAYGVTFQPRENVSFGEMLAIAKAAVGTEVKDCHGREWTVTEFANSGITLGNVGEEISPTLLKYMALFGGMRVLMRKFANSGIRTIPTHGKSYFKKILEQTKEARQALVELGIGVDDD